MSEPVANLEAVADPDGAPAVPAESGHGSLARHVSLLMLAKTTAVVFSFALPLILVRRLTQVDFGLYKQAFLLISTATAILPLGLGMSVFYFLPRAPDRHGAVVFNVLLIYVLIGGGTGLLIVLDPGLLVAIFNGPELVPYASRIALALALLVAGSFLEYVMIARRDMRQAAVFITATQFSKAVLLTAAALWLSTVGALLNAASIQGALQLAWVLVYLRKRFGRYWRVDWGLLRAQLAYGFPLGLAGLLFWVQTQVHLYFVAHRFGPAVYAIYAIGCFEIPLLTIFSDSVSSVMIQRTNDLHSQGRHRELATLVLESVRNLSWFYLPLFAFLMLTGRELIELLFTKQYLASWPIFAIDLILIPLVVPAVACDVLVRAYARYRFYLLRVRIVLAAMLIGTMGLSISRLGPIGAIIIVVAIAAIERTIVSWRLARDLHVFTGQRAMLLDLLTITWASAGAALVTIPVHALAAGQPPIVVLSVCGTVFSLGYLLFSRPWRMFAYAELITALGGGRLLRWCTSARKAALDLATPTHP